MLVGRRVKRTFFALKIENGIPTVGHGIAHRVKRTSFALKTENGIPTVGHDIVHRVKRTTCRKDRKRYTYCRP